MKLIIASIALILVASTVSAQQSPYVDLQNRPIKALSPEETEGLLTGQGLGFALAAELNGYPGPRHVLDLRDELELTPDQLSAVKAIFQEMNESARQTGAKIVRLESVLGSLFASATVTVESLKTVTEAIGSLNGELRWTHLAAHLEMAAILTDQQKRHYSAVRGYGSEGHDGQHGGH